MQLRGKGYLCWVKWSGDGADRSESAGAEAGAQGVQAPLQAPRPVRPGGGGAHAQGRAAPPRDRGCGGLQPLHHHPRAAAQRGPAGVQRREGAGVRGRAQGAEPQAIVPPADPAQGDQAAPRGLEPRPDRWAARGGGRPAGRADDHLPLRGAGPIGGGNALPAGAPGGEGAAPSPGRARGNAHRAGVGGPEAHREQAARGGRADARWGLGVRPRHAGGRRRADRRGAAHRLLHHRAAAAGEARPPHRPRAGAPPRALPTTRPGADPHHRQRERVRRVPQHRAGAGRIGLLRAPLLQLR